MEKAATPGLEEIDWADVDFDIGTDIDQYLLFDTPTASDGGESEEGDNEEAPLTQEHLAKQFEAFRVPELGTLEDVLFVSEEDSSAQKEDAQVLDEREQLLRHPVFRALAQNVRACFYQNIPARQRASSLRWVMCRVPDKHNLYFDDAVKSFGARPYVLRYRTLYEMALRNVDHHQRLDVLAAPLSNAMRTAMRFDPMLASRMGVIEMSEIVWHNPGLLAEEIERMAAERSIPAPKHVLDALLAAGRITASDSGRHFFTAINPAGMALSRRNNLSWSKMLYDD